MYFKLKKNKVFWKMDYRKKMCMITVDEMIDALKEAKKDSSDNFPSVVLQHGGAIHEIQKIEYDVVDKRLYIEVW